MIINNFVNFCQSVDVGSVDVDLNMDVEIKMEWNGNGVSVHILVEHSTVLKRELSLPEFLDGINIPLDVVAAYLEGRAPDRPRIPSRFKKEEAQS